MVGEIPSETVPAILHGMECHPTNEKILIEGCLALGNTGRAGEWTGIYNDWVTEVHQ